MPQPRRVKIGEQRGLMGRERVYQAAEFIEREEVEGFKVRRRRLFYDEIILITRHQQHGVAGLLAMAALVGAVALLGLIALAAAGTDPGGLTLVLLGSPLMALLVLRIAVREEVVTIFGRRGRARVTFWLRRGRARVVYEDLVARVTEARRPPPQ